MSKELDLAKLFTRISLGLHESTIKANELDRANDIIKKYDKYPGGHKAYTHSREVQHAIGIREKYKNLEKRADSFDKKLKDLK